jgi:hypothetical protein
LQTISTESGVPIGQLSQIERGQLLPRDAWVDGLARAYGHEPVEWYPSTVLLAVSGDEPAVSA